MVVRLNKKRMVFQDIHQEIFCCVYHDPDPTSIKSCHNAFVNVFRQGIRNTSRKNKYISFGQCIQFFVKLSDGLFTDPWSLTVDFRLFTGVDFYIDFYMGPLHRRRLRRIL